MGNMCKELPEYWLEGSLIKDAVRVIESLEPKHLRPLDQLGLGHSLPASGVSLVTQESSLMTLLRTIVPIYHTEL